VLVEYETIDGVELVAGLATLLDGVSYAGMVGTVALLEDEVRL